MLAALLAVMIALQFLLVEEEALPVLPGRTVVPQASAQTAGITIADPVIQRAALFAPTRGEGGTAGSGPLDGAAFVGVVTVRGSARAVLQTIDGDAVSVPVRGSFRGWRLVRLTQDSAAFVRDGVRHVAPIARGIIIDNPASSDNFDNFGDSDAQSFGEFAEQ